MWLPIWLPDAGGAVPEPCPCNRCRGTTAQTADAGPYARLAADTASVSFTPFRSFAEPRHATWTPRPLALSPAALSALEQTTCARGHQQITFKGTDVCPLCTVLESTFDAQARALATLDKLASMQERAHAAELAQLRTRGELEALERATRPVAHALPNESVVFKGPTDVERRVLDTAVDAWHQRANWQPFYDAMRALIRERDP